MTTRTIRFDEISTSCSSTGNCPVCGKRVRRSRTFAQTVSPFNRNPDGTVRTRAQISAAVLAERSAWVPDFTHEACAEGVAH